jgi:hypothetical protein
VVVPGWLRVPGLDAPPEFVARRVDVVQLDADTKAARHASHLVTFDPRPEPKIEDDAQAEAQDAGEHPLYAFERSPGSNTFSSLQTKRNAKGHGLMATMEHHLTSTALAGKRLSFIGCGVMAEAIISILIDKDMITRRGGGGGGGPNAAPAPWIVIKKADGPR